MNENLSADDPAYTYPLVLTIRDDYDPRVARHVTNAIAALDDASCRVTVRLAVLEAIRQISKEMNYPWPSSFAWLHRKRKRCLRRLS
jgi:hypothetical protein